ncbi:5-hydroxytryptamine receptor 2A, partial [Stegodyphus mimosarum]
MNLTETPDPGRFIQLPFGNWTNESHTDLISYFDNNSNVSDDNVTRSNLHSSPVLIPEDVPLSTVVLLAVLLGLLILSTAVGNLFVLVAIVRERHLQTVGNYLVLSLAVADMMVACLVMPMGAQYEITNHEWLLGPELCEVWTSGDVLCCTASILHLVAIALDRYWAVTNVQYAREGRRKRIAIMIAIVWS